MMSEEPENMHPDIDTPWGPAQPAESPEARAKAGTFIWHNRTDDEIIRAAFPELPDGQIYGWMTTSGVIYAGEGYPVPQRRFALDNQTCAAFLLRAATTARPTERGAVEARAHAWFKALPVHRYGAEIDGVPAVTMTARDVTDFVAALALPATDQAAEVEHMDGEKTARLFHDTYERLAPSFGYKTRADTKAFDPTTPNGRLMIAVCSEVAATLATQPATGRTMGGEDGMRKACERLLSAMTKRALRGRDHVPSMRDEQDAASALRAALQNGGE
jgi:hypothetical protein